MRHFRTGLVVAALLLVGCGDNAAGPSGPCLDSGYELAGDIELEVSAEAQQTVAAFGWMRSAPCPGANSTGPLESDGFFHTLDQSLIAVEPGGEFAVSGPGFFDAELTTDWTVVEEHSSPIGGTLWTLRAAAEPGRYELPLSLKWAQGEAAYKVLVQVGEDTGP